MTLTPHGLARLGVIVVAAGRGERLGADTPKAFTTLGGRPLIEYAIRTITALHEPGQLVLVIPEGHASATLEIVEHVMPNDSNWQVSLAHGGRERHESVRFGLDVLNDSIETVLIHDAARPLTPSTVFERVAATVRHTRESVIPVIAVSDTLKLRAEGGLVAETVDRSTLVAVQTPQGFVREVIVTAHTALRDDAVRADGIPSTSLPTDDAELVQRAGEAVHTVAGSHSAHKITVATDVYMLEGLLANTQQSGQEDQA